MDAVRFLRQVGLRVDEAVVKEVVLVLRGQSNQSFYDVYASGYKFDGTERRPLCSRVTARKIAGLYQVGALEPFIQYLDAQKELGAPNADQQLDESPHQEEMGELTRNWLGYVDEVTLESWGRMIADYFLSPSGLLNFAHTSLQESKENETIKQQPPTRQDAKESLLRDMVPNLDLPAPPGVIQSSVFPSLSQHLEGDPLWEQWKSYSLELAKFSAHAWLGAAQLVSFAVGAFIARAMPVDTPRQPMDELKRLVEYPSHRDTLSQVLKPVVYLLGGELVSLGLRESKIILGAQAVIYVLSRFMQEMEDNLQRVQIPDRWSRPEVGYVREIADQLWDGSLGEEISQSLGKDYVDELLRSWQGLDRAVQILRSRLKTLVALQNFPGSCSECPKI